MKKRILSILSVCACAFAAVGVATLNVDTAKAQDGAVTETYTEDFTYVDDSAWTLGDYTDGSKAKVEDGKLTLTNISSVYRPLATLNVPYKNYELSFTISDNVCTAGGTIGATEGYRGSAWIMLGDGWGCTLPSYYSADGVIPDDTNLAGVKGINNCLFNNRTNTYSYNGQTMFLLADGKMKFRVEWSDAKSAYLMSVYNWDANANSWTQHPCWGWVGTVPIVNSSQAVGNKIGFGFIGSSGSYSIDDLQIDNLDEAMTDLITQTEKTFDYETQDYVEFDVSADVTADTLYGAYVDHGLLQEGEYTFESGKLRINKQTILDIFAGEEIGATMQLRVCLKDGSYDVATIAYTNMPTYVLSYYNGGTFVTEQTYKPGQKVKDVPDVPDGKVGWYIDKKKLQEGGSVLGDARVEALDETATFDVTFSWVNLQDRETTQTISVDYGYQVTGTEVEIPPRYGYRFIGWDYEGVIDENKTLTAVYRKLEANGSDFLLDFDESVNENYVNYIDLIYPGGYASIEDDYWYVKNPIDKGVLFTEQKFTDFELSLDVVHLSEAYLNDWTLCLSFANAEHNADVTYYGRKYSLSFTTAINNDTQQLYGRSVFFANKTVYKNGSFCGFVDKDNCEVWDQEYKVFTQMFNSGLRPDGEKVNLKLRVYKGEVSYSYKFASETEWTDVYVGKFTEDLTGYIGIQFVSDAWSPYSIGVDNLKVDNLAEDCHEISYSIDDLQQEGGNYVYTVGSMPNARVDIDLRRQNWVGTNVLVYDASGKLVAVEDRPVIVEEIYEIGMFVTLDSRKIAKIWGDYSQYVADKSLRIELEVLTNKDSMRIPLSLRSPDKVSFSYYDGETLLETVEVDFGSSVTLKAFENVPEGYVFVGWKDLEGVVYDSALTAIRNETLVACFEPKEFTVRFMNKDGTPFYSTKVKYGEKVEIPKIDPENVNGYAFVAWIDADRVITGDTDIIAEWKKEGGKKGCGSDVGSYGGIALALTIPVLWVAVRKKEQE